MKRKPLSYQRRKSRIGFLFILPWIIGFAVFVLVPMLQSLYFTFCELTITSKGYETVFVGLDNYKELFTEDPSFLRELTNSVADMMYEVPIILAFSMFISILLNQKFRGRTVARAIFFLPVIITSGVIIYLIQSDGIAANMMQGGGGQGVFLFKTTSFQDLLYQIGLDNNIVSIISNIVNRIFNLSWRSGVQILIFLAALQNVPESFYEASKMEGATNWEAFWKITLPMVSPVIIVNVVYSIIDSFVMKYNAFSTYAVNLMTLIVGTTFGKMRFSYGSAMAWVFFVVIFIIIIIIVRLLSKKAYYVSD